MLRSIEAVIDTDGKVKLKEPVVLKAPCRAIVTIFDDDVWAEPTRETALLSEQALARDWERPEEDEAWSHLQKAR